MAQLNFMKVKTGEQPITLSNFSPHGTSKKTRVSLDCSIRLTGKSTILGLPKAIGDTYIQMASAVSDPGAQFKVFLDHKLENMHIEFFLTPDSPRSALAVDGASIGGFRLERDKGKAETEAGRKRPPADIFLWFTVSFEVGNDREAQIFPWRALGTDIFWEAEVSQKELGLVAGKEA